MRPISLTACGSAGGVAGLASGSHGSPFSSFFHEAPASVDLYTPLPHEELWRLFDSPVPTQTMEGSDGATATAPMVELVSLSKTGSQVVPPLIVFITPPDAVAT